MARKGRGEVRPPDYKSKPTSVSITIYDIQGDPISPRIETFLSQFAEVWIKENGFDTLAISVNRG
jgi:hypothetical protein